MLHETNFLHDTDWNFCFMATSSKGIEHSENTLVTANPTNTCKTELDMSSIGKPVADDDASTLENQSNGGGCGIANMETSSYRNSEANDQPNDDCEFSIDNEFTKAIVNDSQASLKLASVSYFEAHRTLCCQDITEESNVLPPSTSWKSDSPSNAIAACGDIASETGTCISCSPQNAGNIVRDISIYDGTTSKDKLSIVSGPAAVTEKMPNFKTSVENEMNCQEHVSETTLEMIGAKDEKKGSEGLGAAVVEGLREERLTLLHPDDKLILEKTFISHTSNFEEKHVCNPSDLADNVKQSGTGSRSDDCINGSFGLPFDKMENILKDPEKDGDGERESGSFSTHHNEINSTIPVRISQKESVFDSTSHAECLDVRLESSSENTPCKEENRVETVMTLQIFGDDESRVHPLDCETRSDECIISHDIHPGENCRVASDESNSFEVSTLNDKNGKSRDEFPNSDALNGERTCINPYIEVDNSLLQGRPFTVSEKEGDGDRESGSCSNNQKETNLTIPARIHQKECACDSKSDAECLDVRLESSHESPLCQEDNCVETVMAVLSGDDESRVQPSDSATISDKYFASHDIHPDENCRTLSDKIHSFEVSTLNDQKVKDRKLASIEFTDRATVNLLSENKDSDADDPISKDCSQGLTSLLVTARTRNLQGSFSSSHELGLEDSRGSQENPEGDKIVVAEQNITADDQISPGLLLPTKESIETCDLIEKTLIDQEVTNYDTANKSDGDNLPPSELVSVSTDLQINSENQRPETDPGISCHPVTEGKAKQSIVVAEQNLTADQISPVFLHPTKESIKTCDLTDKTSTDPEATNYDTVIKSDSNDSCPPDLVSVNTDLKINSENQRTETDPGFSGHTVIEVKDKQPIVATEHISTCDDQVMLALAHSRKEGNGTCGITEKLPSDIKAANHSALELNVVKNESAPTVTDIDTRKNAMERGVLTSGFSPHPASSAYPGRSSHESISGHPVSSVNGGRNSHESPYDAFDDITVISDMAESSRYTYSGPISGPISYSGPIPFSGSISHRSDSSTTSTRSFAFPILASEWNSSPVKMTQADPRYYRKKRGWQFLCFCGGSTSPD